MNMEIQDVRFTRLYVAEHVQFGEEVSELIAVAPFRDELPAFNTYLALREEEKRILKKLTGSYLTPELERCDETCDVHTYGFFTVAKGLCHHYDQEAIAAADVVAKALKPYKRVYKITFNQETATLSRMIAELEKDEFVMAVSRLGLTEWVNTIDADNRRFADLVLQRNATLAKKVEGNMKDIRSRVDPAYYDLIRPTTPWWLSAAKRLTPPL
ncbi:hypothetical protein FACS1894181_02230 [Bacteroidia bacterium]|nr:hypothetical protein FACS1894181_02230 [Bacteroidia bacterium]